MQEPWQPVKAHWGPTLPPEGEGWEDELDVTG